jgi:hypothetical protein
MKAMLGPQSTCFCCHWLCRHETKCGGAYQKIPEPAACIRTHKHCPKSLGRNDFAVEFKGSLILGLHTCFSLMSLFCLSICLSPSWSFGEIFAFP